MNQIHPLAVVDPNAQLGDNNVIGPFCVIDKNVIIGDNNKFLNNVTIHYGARIGSNNEFFPGASISTKPQDLKFQGEDTTCEIGDNNSIRGHHQPRYGIQRQNRCGQRQPTDGEHAHWSRLCHRQQLHHW